MGKSKKSKKSYKSQKSQEHTFFNTQSDMDYEDNDSSDFFNTHDFHDNLAELNSLKMQHVSIDFQTNEDLWTVSGYLLGTTSNLAKLAPALLNHKTIYENYIVDVRFITNISHKICPPVFLSLFPFR